MPKYELTTPAHEYAKIAVSMLVGSGLTIYALVLFMIHAGFFVPKGTALVRQAENIFVTRQMTSPINEFAGMEKQIWEKVQK